MEKFWVDIVTPYWWVSVIVVGVAVNGLSAWVLPRLLKLLRWSRASSVRVSNAQVRRLARTVVLCHKTPGLALLLAVRQRRSAVMSALCLGMGLFILFAVSKGTVEVFGPASEVFNWMLRGMAIIVSIGGFLFMHDAMFCGRVVDAFTDDLLNAASPTEAEIDAQLAKKLPTQLP